MGSGNVHLGDCRRHTKYSVLLCYDLWSSCVIPSPFPPRLPLPCKNDAPSQKGCVDNGQATDLSNKLVRPPPPALFVSLQRRLSASLNLHHPSASSFVVSPRGVQSNLITYLPCILFSRIYSISHDTFLLVFFIFVPLPFPFRFSVCSGAQK